MRRNRAKKLQNFRNFGAPRAQNLGAFGQRTLRKPQNIVASLHRVGCALYMQKLPRDAPRSRKSSAKLARNHCKIPRILARRGQRSCLKSASMRCVTQTISLQLLNAYMLKNIFTQVPQVLASLTQAYASDKCLLASLTQAYASHRLTCVTCLSLCR